MLSPSMCILISSGETSITLSRPKILMESGSVISLTLDPDTKYILPETMSLIKEPSRNPIVPPSSMLPITVGLTLRITGKFQDFTALSENTLNLLEFLTYQVFSPSVIAMPSICGALFNVTF